MDILEQEKRKTCSECSNFQIKEDHGNGTVIGVCKFYSGYSLWGEKYGSKSACKTRFNKK